MAHVATLTIDHTKVAGDLTDYVVAIIPNSDAGWASLYALATEGGGDIRVYKDDDTTELAREIVTFSVSSETGEIHVKYSGTLSSSVDTDIHIYADGASSDYAITDTYGRNNVWTDFVAVVHAQSDGENSTGSTDFTEYNSPAHSAHVLQNGSSTGTGNNGLLDTTPYSYKSSQIGSSNLGFETTGTISFWANILDSDTEQHGLAGNYVPSRKSGWEIGYTNGTLKVSWGKHGVGSGGSVSESSISMVGSDHLVTATMNGSSMELFRNAVSKGTGAFSGSGTGTTGSAALFMQSFPGWNWSSNGQIWVSSSEMDEYRVATSVLSDNRITTDYNNQSDPTSFYSVAAVVTGPPAYIGMFGLVEKA